MQLKTIRAKLFLVFGILILVICLGIGGIAYQFSANMIRDTMSQYLTQVADDTSKIVQARLSSYLNALEVVAQTDVIQNDEASLEEKLAFLRKEAARSGHIRMAIADLAGNSTFTDGSTVDISDRDYFARGLQGESSILDPLVSRVDSSIVLNFVVPIKSETGQVKGLVVASRNGAELSMISEDIVVGESGEVMIVNGAGTTVGHSIPERVLEMFNPIEAAKSDENWSSLAKVTELMTQGQQGEADYVRDGQVRYIYYMPVPINDWSLGITIAESEVLAQVNRLLILMMAVAGAIFVAGMFVTVIIGTSISKPIRGAAEYLEQLATGDFREEIPVGLLKYKDETGILANAAQKMQKSIKGIVRKVTDESSQMGRTLLHINEEMERLNRSIEEIAATTQQISAGSEETAASTEEMNATSEEIERAAESISQKAQEGAITVGSISKMSDEMKENAVKSSDEAVNIYKQTREELRLALQQSKEVERINSLSEAILEITSQTNLLALNAAIEAARAGEAGRGFAVVADEIRVLAEGSKATVTKIQEVTKVILDSVTNLSSSANGILAFVDEKVLKDYEYFVSVSQKSSDNSQVIDDLVTDFSATSEELLASIQNMVKAIEEVSSASNDSANGTASIARESTTIAEMSGQISQLAEGAKKKSEELIQVVGQFKI